MTSREGQVSLVPYPTGLRRVGRVLALTIIGVEALWITAVFLVSAASNPAFGLDYRWHMDAAQRLLDTGTPYLAFELAGPFEISNGAILYPPPAFFLFLPFLVLPTALWYAIPIGILGACLWWHRPPLLAWVVIFSLLALEKSLNVYVFGNPSMWVVAAIAAGTVYRWAFALVLIKPTFAPIAALGIRDRWWWVAVAVLFGLSFVMWPVWLDWLTVVQNSDVSLLYNLPTLPLMLVPLAAWAAGRHRPALIDRWYRATVRAVRPPAAAPSV